MHMWDKEPNARPSFKDLHTEIKKLMSNMESEMTYSYTDDPSSHIHQQIKPVPKIPRESPPPEPYVDARSTSIYSN